MQNLLSVYKIEDFPRFHWYPNIRTRFGSNGTNLEEYNDEQDKTK